MNKFVRAFVSLALLASMAKAAQFRSRAEAIPGLQASNTVGLGDIWVTGGTSSFFQVRPVSNQVLAQTVDSVYRNDFRQLYGSENRLHRDVVLAPIVGATLGLANFMQFEVEGIPWDGNKLGATTGRLKITTPNNDNLRVIGVAVMVNATLSTEEDIYSRGATTPGFDPLLYFTGIADLDLIKWFPALPLKAYFNYSNLDEYRLVHAYSQHQFRGGIEYMGNRKGYYLRGGLALYKPLATRFNPNPSKDFLENIYEFGMGYRHALGDRFTFTVDLSFDPVHPISFYSQQTHKPPKIQMNVSAPILFNETRAEAIRALIFNEEQRKRYRKLAEKNPTPKPTEGDSAAVVKGQSAGLKVDEVSLEERKNTVKQSGDAFKGVFDDSDGDVADKRKQIRGELKQIEDLLQ